MRDASGRVLIAVLAMVLVLGGCSGSSSKALELYESGRYEEAISEGDRAASGSGTSADRGTLIAGLSALELKRYAEAERRLKPLVYNTNAEIAGRAQAGIGLCQVARDRFSAAAVNLSSAGRRLSGDEGAQAHYFAGECYAVQGRLEAAKLAYEAAQAKAESPELKKRIAGRLSASEYTLQVGAFSSEQNARRTLAAVSRRAASANVGTASIVSLPDVTGRTIHLVQIGRFTTRQEAAAARTRLGTDAVVVARRDPSSPGPGAARPAGTSGDAPARR
ncbi:MAG: SPOR domain-containing protein [Planctomycetota bacterium]|nr:SPOR domain-containing protein [Planctomycetota bacterium]